MKPLLQILFIFSFSLLSGTVLYAQPGLADTGISKVSGFLQNLQPGVLKALDKQYERMGNQLTKQSDGYFKRLERKEEKLKKKLIRTDSVKAQQVFGDVKQRYAALRNKLQQGSGKLQMGTNYIPGLDSMSTATKYLTQTASGLPGYSPEKLQLLQQLNGNFSSVQQQMQAATDIKQMLRQRQIALKQQLQNTAIARSLDGLNKEVYYYQQQLNEYNQALNDPDKLMQKALGVLRETSLFKDFMSKNSMLASLFPTPAGYGTAQALAGLQTRAGVQQLLQNQLGSASAAAAGQSGSSGAEGYLQQQVQSAQGQLNQLKDKMNQLGGGSSDMEMPDFKPNSQRTRSFLKRIELGFNIQSQKTNYLLPTTSDIALTAGYKFTDFLTAGSGLSYKLGWGNGYKDISLSNQGIGLRTYGEVKLRGKANLWLTTGYEQNFYPELKDKLDSLPAHSYSGWGPGWQASGLVGLTKKYKIGKKTGNFQLLWDFLSYSQVPRASAIKFRIGYTL